MSHSCDSFPFIFIALISKVKFRGYLCSTSYIYIYIWIGNKGFVKSLVAQMVGTSWYVHDIQGSNPTSPIVTIKLSKNIYIFDK